MLLKYQNYVRLNKTFKIVGQTLILDNPWIN